MKIFVVLVTAIIVTGAVRKIEEPCKSFLYIGHRTDTCVPHRVFYDAFKSQVSYGNISGQAVLDSISILCSNQTLKQEYHDCYNEIIEDCSYEAPVRQFVQKVSQSWLDFFCLEDNASEWILNSQVGSESVWITSECAARADNTHQACFRDFLYPILPEIPSMTIEVGGNKIEKLTEDIFFCTEKLMRNMPTDNCASSREDLFLIFWISNRVALRPAMVLTDTCVETLKNCKMGLFQGVGFQLFS